MATSTFSQGHRSHSPGSSIYCLGAPFRPVARNCTGGIWGGGPKLLTGEGGGAAYIPVDGEGGAAYHIHA